MKTGTTQEGQWGQERGTMRTRITKEGQWGQEQHKRDNEDKNNTGGTMRTRTTQGGKWGQKQHKIYLFSSQMIFSVKQVFVSLLLVHYKNS